ncbi:MAG: hypothetical protein OXR66_07755 [Candidatus Woesearchaeota archaeon]|nr:hypothetical protein [Candidatus Woesearchaeota archaeon]
MDNFFQDPEMLTDEDEKTLKGLKHKVKVDPVTGRKQKKINILNKKQLSKHEMDEFFLDM